MRACVIFCSLVFGAANCFANAILLPAGTVPATSTTGVSFTYAGTLTQNDTLAFTESSFPCLQAGAIYCTNGAGIVTVAGTSSIGQATSFTGTFNGTTATWTYGALLVEISGEGTTQIFPANAVNGLGSSNPPASLTLASTSLASLGFGSFSAVNPTITFILADTLYSDNSGQFLLTQSVPEPCSGLLVAALGGLALLVRRVATR